MVKALARVVSSVQVKDIHPSLVRQLAFVCLKAFWCKLLSFGKEELLDYRQDSIDKE